MRDAVGVPDDWMLAGHVVVGWPRGRHGPLRRQPLDDVLYLDHWDRPATVLTGTTGPGERETSSS